VGETPWIHLDIAGTAWVESNEPYKPKGNVGMGVRLMTHLVKDLLDHPFSGSAKKGARKEK